MDWFLYDNGLRHERVKSELITSEFNMDLKLQFVSLNSLLINLNFWINTCNIGF